MRHFRSGRLRALTASVLVVSATVPAWAASPPDPFRPLAESDVHAYIAYTPAIVRELGRSLAATPPSCVPLDRLSAAAAAVRYPGAYDEVSFLVWNAYEAVIAGRTGDPEQQARFAAVPADDRALVGHHVDEVALLIASLQRALAELRCREARVALPRRNGTFA